MKTIMLSFFGTPNIHIYMARESQCSGGRYTTLCARVGEFGPWTVVVRVRGPIIIRNDTSESPGGACAMLPRLCRLSPTGS